MAKPAAAKIDSRLLALDDIAIRWNGRVVFPRTRWTWRRGEQWAVLGPNGSGKSLFALALCGQAPLQRGEIHYYFDGLETDAVPEKFIALLSPRTQRDLAAAESSFYQSRWHSGISEGRRNVAQFLSQASVEDRNPFEVADTGVIPAGSAKTADASAAGSASETLFRRRLAVLSNGEQRKVILVHTLLRSPRLLILDDPFGGLDRATRACLQKVIQRLMRAGLPVLLITNRPDELPPGTTHLLLVRNQRIIAQGTRRAVLKHPLPRELVWCHKNFPSTGGSEYKKAPDQRVSVLDCGSPLPLFVAGRAGEKRQRAAADVLWFASGVFIKVVHKVWVGCSLVQVSEPRRWSWARYFASS